MGAVTTKSKPRATKPPKKATKTGSGVFPDFTQLTSAQGMANALANAAAELCQAGETGEVCEPLYRNLELWIAIKTLVNGAGTDVADPLRGNLLRLAEYVAGATTAAGRDFAPDRLNQLIDINTRIAQGLIEGTVNQLVRDRAYHLWLEAGSPDGRDQEHWLAAEQEILAALNS